MKFYRNLYVSPDIKNLTRTKWKLRHNAGELMTYVILLSGGTREAIPGGNQLELMHCANLHQPFYKKRNNLIIGIAGSKKSGIELIRQMTQDCLDCTGTPDLKAYLFSKEADAFAKVRKKRREDT